jgi:hypothetical protein
MLAMSWPLETNAAWQQTAFPFSSAQTQTLAAAPSQPSRVYLGLSGLGVYRSDNRGTTWASASQGLPIDSFFGAIVVSYTNPDHVWAGVDGPPNESGVVWKSTNGGGSWSPSSGINARFIGDLLIHAGNPSIMVVSVTSGASPGIYRSTDAGSTWALASAASATFYFDLTAQSSAPDVILAGSSNGVARSTDAGLTWTPGGTGQTHRHVLFAPSDVNRAYATRWEVLLKSTDAGISFTDAGSIPQFEDINTFAVHPTLPDQILAAGRGTGCGSYGYFELVYKSTSAGSNWTNVYTDPICTGGEPTKLVYDPIDPNHVYLGQRSSGGGGFTHSTSGGAPGTWVKKVNGIPNYGIGQIEGSLAGTNYAQLWENFYRSSNNLAVWTALPPTGLSVMGSVLDVNLTTPNRLWETGEKVEGGDMVFSFLHRSTNSGLSWTPLGGMPPGIPESSSPVQTFTNHGDGSYVYVPTTTGLYRSSDAGLSYALVNAASFHHSTKMVIDPADGLRVFANGYGSTPPVRLSEDGGVTFFDRSAGLPPASLQNIVQGLFMRRSDPDYLEVVYNNGEVWETFDGGVSWSLRFTLNVNSAPFTYMKEVVWDEATGHVFAAPYNFITPNIGGVVASHPLYDPAGLPTLLLNNIHWDAAQSVLLAATQRAGMWHQVIASPVDAPVLAQSSPFAIVVSPNPAREFTQAEFEVPAGGARVTGNVFDASGRLVRRLIDADLPAGQRRLLWDGRAESGERASAGIYFVRIRARDFEGTAKIVRLD